MKHIYTLLILIIPLISIGQNNDLYVLDNNGNGQTNISLPTGSGFILDLLVDVPLPACQVAVVEFSLPTEVRFFSLYGNNYTIVSNTTSLLKVEFDITSVQQFQFNMGMTKAGAICANVPIIISATINYKDSNGNICAGTNTSNSVSILPTYTENYDLTLSREPTDDPCVGGYTKYKLNVKAPSYLGGFKLVQNQITAQLSGSDIKVFDRLGNLISVTTTGTGCQKTVSWNQANFDLYNNGNTIEYIFYITKKNDCTCYQVGDSDNIEVEVNGTDPCSEIYTFESNFTYNFTENCCATGSPINVSTYKSVGSTNGTQFCSGGCINNLYTISYNNQNNPFDVQGLQIQDQLPAGVNVQLINFYYYNQNLTNPSQFCYTTNQAAEICLSLGVDANPSQLTFSNNPNSYSNRMLNINERVTSIKFVHGGTIPAWYGGPQDMYIGFLIDQGFTQLNDNVANYSSASPLWSDSKTVTHNPSPPCLADYENTLRVFDSFSSQYLAQTQAFPQEIVRMSTVITNLGVGTSPIASVDVVLPPGLTYVGNETYGYQPSTQNTVVSGSLPTTASVTYNTTTNKVTFNNLIILPICGQSPIPRMILQYDVLVMPGTLAGVKTVRSYLPAGTNQKQGIASINVNEKYDVESSVFFICNDELVSDRNPNIKLSDEVEIVYEVFNTGNVPVSNIQMIINRPKIGDIIIGSGVPRNSQFNMSFLNSPIELNNRPITTNFSNILPANLCNTTSTSQGQEFLIINQVSGQLLVPGEKFQIKQKYVIDPTSQLSDISYSDFYYCLLRGDINTNDAAISDQRLTLTINEASQCGKNTDCDGSEIFLNRVEGDFQVALTGNQLSVTNNTLVDADAWFPIWGDNTSGGAGYHWGSGQYGVSHTYTNTGIYDVCLHIENYQEIQNRDSNRCHCKIICQQIEIK